MPKSHARSGSGSHDKAHIPASPGSFIWIAGFFTALITATIFLSGERIAQSGAGAPLFVLWFIAAAVLASVLIVKRKSIPARMGVLDVIWFVVSGLFFVSAAYHCQDGLGNVRYGINLACGWTACAGSWFFARQILHDRRLSKSVLIAVISLSVALSAYGLYRHFVETPGMIREFEADPQGVLQRNGMDPSPDSADYKQWRDRLYTSTPTATYSLTNTLAGLIVPVLILTLGISFSRNIPSRVRLTLGVCALCLGTCLVYTESRSGCIAVAFGVCVLGVIRMTDLRFVRAINRGRRLIIISVITALFAISGLYAASISSVWETARKSLGFRFEYWQASLGMIADNPLLGCGPGNFQQAYTKYKLPISSEEIADPHNFAVDLAAIAGIPAAVAFLAIPLFLTLLLLKRREDDTPEYKRNDKSGNGVPETPDSPERTGKTSGDGMFSSQYFTSKSEPIILLGGLSGIALGWGASLFSEFTVPFSGLVLCLAIASCCGFLILPLLKSEEEISPWILWAAVMSLLINLLAAGGVTYSNLVVIFWVFSALIANGVIHGEKNRVAETQADRKEHSNKSPLLVRIALVMLFCVFAAASIFTYRYMYRPVVDSARLVAEADAHGRNPLEQADQLRQAVAADPYSPEIRFLYFATCMRLWENKPSDHARLDTVLKAEAATIKSDPGSSSLRIMIGNHLYESYWRLWSQRKGPPKELLELAKLRFKEAVDLYPNHAKIRAPYAITLWESDEKEEAIRQRDIALKLDEMMPHEEQKLQKSLRNRLESFK